MSVDPKILPPKYQAQIAAKLLQGQREAAKMGVPNPGRIPHTPDVRKAENGKEIHFASKAEARRYDELTLLLKAGKIRNLKLQPEFTLQEAYTTPDGVRVRAIRYRADFSYDTVEMKQTVGKCNGVETPIGKPFEWHETVVEDVKSPASKTRVYEIKKKLMRERLGIEIVEVE